MSSVRRHATWPASARIYVALVNLLGLATLALCSFQFASRPEAGWFGLAALTAITSALAIRIPVPGGQAGGLAFTVSDCFVFIALLVYGLPAAALTAAIDGLVTGIRCKIKRPERFGFNVAIVSLDAALAALLYRFLTGTAEITMLSAGALAALGIAAVTYFLFNTLLVAAAMALVSGESFSRIWKTNFPWASPSLLTNTLAALLLVLALDRRDPSGQMVMAVLGVASLALSAVYLLKGRRWMLDRRIVGQP